jgi:hypothetical protein
MGATNVWTYTLANGSLTISSSDNATRLSVICRLGNITVVGNSSFQGIASDPVQLNEGQGVTLSASAVSNPIDGVTITSSGAGNIAEIILSKS